MHGSSSQCPMEWTCKNTFPYFSPILSFTLFFLSPDCVASLIPKYTFILQQTLYRNIIGYFCLVPEFVAMIIETNVLCGMESTPKKREVVVNGEKLYGFLVLQQNIKPLKQLEVGSKRMLQTALTWSHATHRAQKQ